VKLGAEVTRSQVGVDSGLLPEYQGRGLYGHMLDHAVKQAAEQDIPLQLDFGGHPASAHSWTKRQALLFPKNPLATLFKPLDAARAASRARHRGGLLRRAVDVVALEAASFAYRLRYGRSRRPEPSSMVETISWFDDSAHELWTSASAEFDFIPVRDPGFLNWRYCDERGGSFAVRAIRDLGRMDGYCVLKMSGGRAYIVDLLVRPGRLNVLERLVWDADRYAREHQADGIDCQLPVSHPYRRTLLRAGFIPGGQKVNFALVIHAPDRNLAFLGRSDARIHVTMGDSDLV
jgi:hypothetical protein